jgi:uncharacterized protein YkwD
VQLELELEELQVLELHILQHLELELEQVMVQLLNKEAKLEQQELLELLAQLAQLAQVVSQDMEAAIIHHTEDQETIDLLNYS